MRIEHEVVGQYRKDREEESFLAELNEVLAPYERESYCNQEEVHATLFILGVPRSGTTLLSQLVSAHLSVGYVNNLIACFWEAPGVGIRLSKKLFPRLTESSYESRYGRTMGVQEPHEFGYFWTRFLGSDPLMEPDELKRRSVDWGGLKETVLNMTQAFSAPVVFKYLPLCWYLPQIRQILTRSCFVWVRRDPCQTAISLLKARQSYLGSTKKWLSLKPAHHRQLRSQPVAVQLAQQVFSIEKCLEENFLELNGEGVLKIEYSDLCENPERNLHAIRSLLSRAGDRVSLTGEPPPGFTPKLEDPDQARFSEVSDAVDRLYRGTA